MSEFDNLKDKAEQYAQQPSAFQRQPEPEPTAPAEDGDDAPERADERVWGTEDAAEPAVAAAPETQSQPEPGLVFAAAQILTP